MSRSLDPTLLQTFVAIADYGGFGRAGERLHMAQPTVSAHIRRLENHLGAKLFRREGRSMVITESGYQLLRYARRILTLNDEAWASIGANGITGQLRLGIIQDLTDAVLADLIAGFSRDYPEVRMELVVANSGELERDLEDDRLDIAILAGKETDHTPLFRREPMIWIGSETQDFEDDETVSLALCASPCGIREMAVSLLEASGLKWRVAFTSPSLAGVKAAVRAGLGITLRGTSALSPGLVRLTDTRRLPQPPAFDMIVKRSLHRTNGPATDEMERLITRLASRAG